MRYLRARKINQDYSPCRIKMSFFMCSFCYIWIFLCAISTTLWAKTDKAVGKQEFYTLSVRDCYNYEKYSDGFVEEDEHLAAFKVFYDSLLPPTLNSHGEANLNYTQKVKFRDLIGRISNIHGDSFTRFSPLACACYFGFDTWVFHFERSGVDLDQFNGLPLEKALSGRHLDVAYYLISSGADVNQGNALRLVICNEKHYRTKNGFVFPDEVIQYFTEAGADFSQKADVIASLLVSGKDSPKHCLKMIEFLLLNGADPNIGISWSYELPLDLDNLADLGRHNNGTSLLSLAEALHESTLEQKKFKKRAILLLKYYGAVHSVQEKN